jgi:CubicO group peptidase (beta-lactamase class C family)
MRIAFIAVALALALPASAEKLAADTPITSLGGATFTAASGWDAARGDKAVTLTAPEGDSRVTIVDVQAKDAAEAAAKAWDAYKPEAKRPIRVSTPQAPVDGWDERQAVTYETSPNERKVVYAIAARAGASWTVAIVDAAEPTFEKRLSQFSVLMRSLRPKGYTRETFAGRTAKRLDAEKIATINAFVEDGMKKLGVPGVGLALLDAGQVVYEGGLGVKELGKPDKVDAHTLFIAASNTKGLTTLLISELVDEKKLRWDERAVDAYPAFKLGDAKTTNSVLIKHLICACTGMPRQDMEWLFEYNKATPASAMKLLGTMQPTSGFGELFQYSNLMAAAAGYIAGHTLYPDMELGAAYDRAMQEKVFKPLGMKDTTFDYARALRGNHASPHAKDADGVLKVARQDPNYSIVPARPAGGVWTSAHDLAQYVRMELARGKLPDGKRLVSEENLRARAEPQVRVSENVDYGMGLTVDKQWGVQVVHHGGDLFGYHSDMMWFPDHGIGAVILTNSDPGFQLRGPLLRRIAELAFDGKAEAQARIDAAAIAMETARKKERERLAIPADPAAVDKLAKRYVNKDLGPVDVSRNGKDVVFDVGEWKSTVATRKNDDGTVSFVTIDPTMDGFEFVVADRDGKRMLMMRDAQHEYLFTEAL